MVKKRVGSESTKSGKARKKSDYRVVKRYLNRYEKPAFEKKSISHNIIIFSGFALLLLFIFSLGFRDFASRFPWSGEAFLVLISVLTFSFVFEGYLRIKRGSVYQAFYSSCLVVIFSTFSIIYWISYLKDIDVPGFKTFIIMAQVFIFLYSLIVLKYSDRFWYILVSYLFLVLATISLFSYLYWTLSIFGNGQLQFSECNMLSASLKSENWLYFSSVTFYTLGYGDICPYGGGMRFVSQIEVVTGVLINTILIGLLFWKIRQHRIRKRALR